MSCRKYLRQQQDPRCPNLIAFLKAWESAENSRVTEIKASSRARLSNGASFEDFLLETERVEEQSFTNPRRFQRLVELRKLFSVPWLLAHEVLFDKQDFLKRVFALKQIKMKSSGSSQDVSMHSCE